MHNYLKMFKLTTPLLFVVVSVRYISPVLGNFPRYDICYRNTNSSICEKSFSQKSNNENSKLYNLLDLWKIYPMHIIENASSVTPLCQSAYNKYLEALSRYDVNAAKMFDASGKLSSGILRGNVNQYGNFDECLEVVNAQYCLAEINILPFWKKPYSKFQDLVHSHFVIRETLDDPKHRIPGFSMIRWGFCIPKECTNVDLQNAILEKIGIQSKVSESMCQTKTGNFQESTGKIIAKYFFLMILVLVISATLLDYLDDFKTKNGFWTDLLMSFSLEKNYRKMVTINTSSNEINCLHGIRAIAAFALIVCHKSMALFYNPYINRSEMTEALGQRWSVLGRNAILYTEFFMLMSGLLNANSLFSDLDKTGRILFKDKLINRLFRRAVGALMCLILGTRLDPAYSVGFLLRSLENPTAEDVAKVKIVLVNTQKVQELDYSERVNFFIREDFRREIGIVPNLLAVILFCTYILPEYGSGPLWPLVINHHAELCKKYMWRNFLFIHNYYGFEKMCLTHTHQVGIDMQLYLITPIIVYLMWKRLNLGLWLLGITSLLSTLLRFIVTWKHDLSHVVYFGIPISRMFKTATLSYILPTHRATIYLMGVFLAYIMRYTTKSISFTKKQQYVIDSIAYMLGLITLLGPVNMCVKGFQYDKLIASLYGAFSPIFFGAAVAWVIYAIDRGYGSLLDFLLKWKYYIVFTKISYAVYLVQFPVFFYNIGKNKHVAEYKPYMMLEVVETAIVILISMLLTLTIEMPFQNIKKIIFDNDKTKIQEAKTIGEHSKIK